jgi:predicted RNA methylase
VILDPNGSYEPPKTSETPKTQAVGLHRDSVDKYYTKQSVVDLCVNYVRSNGFIDMKNDIIIEPSAGNGAFIAGIRGLASRVLFLDLLPENEQITQQDYLELDVRGLMEASRGNRIHVIGNPPFGRQSSLAIKFIKKSCRFADSVSFILPKSFKKDRLQKAFPLHFHLILQKDLPKNSFIVSGVEYDVPCVFQIWVKMGTIRVIKPILEPIHFAFVKQTEQPDISVRRIGANAGMISLDTRNKSVESHYFITFTNSETPYENIQRLSGVAYEFDNTVGPKSISKQELVEKFNGAYEKSITKQTKVNKAMLKEQRRTSGR